MGNEVAKKFLVGLILQKQIHTVGFLDVVIELEENFFPQLRLPILNIEQKYRLN